MVDIQNVSDELLITEVNRRLFQKKLVGKNALDEVANVQPAPPKEQFPAVCSGCGQQTTVPFRPNPNRPVYCIDCYKRGLSQ